MLLGKQHCRKESLYYLDSKGELVCITWTVKVSLPCLLYTFVRTRRRIQRKRNTAVHEVG